MHKYIISLFELFLVFGLGKMAEILGWLKISAIGVLFGLFPAWWWSSAIIIQAAIHENKAVPEWMMQIAKNNPFLSFFHITLFHKRYYPFISKVLAIIWTVVILAFIHYGEFIAYKEATILEVIELESSFVFFMLLTLMLPAFFLKKYFKHLKPIQKIYKLYP